MYKKEISKLKSDPILKAVIDKHGELEWKLSQDLFEDLVDAIISQQLSGKAAATIFGRFKKLFGRKFPLPKKILKMEEQKMRDAGLSWAKIKYIKNLSENIENGSLILADLDKLGDEEVINELTKVKGIGRWTAEMILMFSLRRPDIFSFGDLGLRKAVSTLYNVKIDDMEKIKKISLRWSPYRSIASRYLWKSLDNV